MPNTVTTKSYKQSGMNKNDGNIVQQGYDGKNTTYPECSDTQPHTDDAPINTEYARRIPNKIEPLGSVSLTEVSRG